MKQLATILVEDVLNTLVKVLYRRCDGLKIQRNDARHCQLKLLAAAYCRGYLMTPLSKR